MKKPTRQSIAINVPMLNFAKNDILKKNVSREYVNNAQNNNSGDSSLGKTKIAFATDDVALSLYETI